MLGGRTVAILSLLALGACEDGPRTVDLHGIEVPVPDGWTAEHTGDGPRQTLTLRPAPPGAFCQIVVIRDGRLFRDDDAHALLGDGLATFGGRDRRDVELETRQGDMRGFALEEAEPQPSWGVTATGRPEVEMYAAPRRIRLLAAVVGTFEGEPGAAEDAERCREIVRGLE